MKISSFPKAAASPQAAPHALPNKASAASSREAVKNIFDGRCLKNNVMVNTQEQRDGLPLKRGRDWTFPASAKIEDIEYVLLQSEKGGNQQAGLMSSDTCPPSFVACLRVLAPRLLLVSWFPFVVLHRIRGFQRLEFRDFVPATACVSFSHVFLQAVRRTAHCHFNRV